MYFYSIIFGFSLCTFVLSDEEFDKDIKDVAATNEITKLQSLNRLITKTESYMKRIDELNETYDIKIMEGMDKIRLEYETGITKQHLFSCYFQCSQASFALEYLKSTESVLLKTSIKNEDREHLNYISDAINGVILKMMAILFDMKYSPPKWMMMLSIICEDLNKKTEPKNYEKDTFLEHLEKYIRADFENIKVIIKTFLKQCDTNLKPKDLGPYSKYETNEDVKKYNNYNDDIYELSEAMKSSTNVLDFKYYESFKSDQWLLSKAFSDSQTFFLPNAEKEGIIWNKIDETIIAKVNQLLSNGPQKNAVLELYKNPQEMIDIQNFMKNVYQIVVVRFLYVGSNLCDNMGSQIVENVMNNEMAGIFTEKCKPMIQIVNSAIEFLGGNEFLESLKPLVEEYVKSPSDRVSSIRLNTFWQLNHLGGLMGVDAIDPVTPQFEDVKLLEEPNPSADKIFKWIPSFFENAINYTNNIKTAIPFLNFKVVEYVQNSANNTWIHRADPS